ncbi:hypothetical protein GQ464_013975 [Rhodocaloribacter litoris]|uniref:hypothetical protein n=1 Tax=Rhodocaloribacter litoris TaxID=2558931 RepID=UPI001421AA6E|nr:hypothetical protein [Rhodocaloribacter litoris]QXD14528.1 hypothetical protein GQ464_013975 [Rhodocaloribacter litoris]
MENDALQNQDSGMLDWLLDHVALMVVALAAVAAGSVALGSSMVAFGVLSWADASEIALYTGLALGAVIVLYRVCRCIREACHGDIRHVDD